MVMSNRITSHLMGRLLPICAPVPMFDVPSLHEPEMIYDFHVLQIMIKESPHINIETWKHVTPHDALGCTVVHILS